MPYPKIAQVVVGLPVEGPFDYALNEDQQKEIAIGQRVSIVFNRKKRIGYVVALRQKSPFSKLNPILSVLDQVPALDRYAIELTKQFSEYYGCSRGEAIEAYFPLSLRKANQTRIVQDGPAEGEIVKGKMWLVHDIGQTQRWGFLQGLIKEHLDNQKSVIFLVPEKFYIERVVEQISRGMKDRSPPIIILDKKLSLQKDLAQWLYIKTTPATVVVGTRSAVFAPVSRLGLIVVYDEDNPAYKQEQSPHYHADVVARMRQSIEGGDIVFVSSTPSAEIWEMARKDQWNIKVFESTSTNELQMIDMGNYKSQRVYTISYPLQNAIERTLNEGGKVILFMNRKGFSTLTKCNQCGFVVQCDRCEANLAYMYSKKKLVCPHCHLTKDLPKICPQCDGNYLRSVGTGTEKLQSEVARLYPQAVVACFDKESRKIPARADIMIATQAIVKFSGQLAVELAAVIHYDTELNRFDFRSGHRAFSLLVHLRQMAKKTLMVQTRMPDNYGLGAVRTMDFNRFYSEELNIRRELGFPPFTHLLSIGVRGEKEEDVMRQSHKLFTLLNEHKYTGLEVFNSQPDIMPKLRDQYRYTIMLKGKSVKRMMALIKNILKGFARKKTIVTINVDP